MSTPRAQVHQSPLPTPVGRPVSVSSIMEIEDACALAFVLLRSVKEIEIVQNNNIGYVYFVRDRSFLISAYGVEYMSHNEGTVGPTLHFQNGTFRVSTLFSVVVFKNASTLDKSQRSTAVVSRVGSGVLHIKLHNHLVPTTLPVSRKVGGSRLHFLVDCIPNASVCPRVDRSPKISEDSQLHYHYYYTNSTVLLNY